MAQSQNASAFTLASLLIGLANALADLFVKSDRAKQIKATVVTVATAAVEALANQNPDGTPATQPYVGPPAKVAGSVAGPFVAH